MTRAMGVVISGLRRSIWLSWSKSLYETSLRPCSSITSEYSSAGVTTSLNPNSLKRSLISACTSSRRVDSGGSTSRVPGVVANFLGVSGSIREAILTDDQAFGGPTYLWFVRSVERGVVAAAPRSCYHRSLLRKGDVGMGAGMTHG